MSKLDRRIAELEQKFSPAASIDIICNFVSVRWQDGVAFATYKDSAKVFDRRSNESKESESKENFLSRVSVEAQPK